MAKNEDSKTNPPSTISEIDAPARTGAGPTLESTTSQRQAVTRMKPLEAIPPSGEVEERINRQVEEAMEEEYVQQEAQRRVAAARADRLMRGVNTDNPYALEEGQKPVYQVRGHLHDPDGVIMGTAQDFAPSVVRVEKVLDPATQMKEM